MGQIVVEVLVGVCSKQVGVRGRAMAIERSTNLSDEVTESRSSVRAKEERVEREGWIVNSWRR